MDGISGLNFLRALQLSTYALTVNFRRKNREPLQAQEAPTEGSMIPDRSLNPNTGQPFRCARSKVVNGRIICKGQDYTDFREQVGKREGEICQRCEAWAAIQPPEGHWPGETHHIHGRGAGKRNDSVSREESEWLCHDCHNAAKIKRRIYSGLPADPIAEETQ